MGPKETRGEPTNGEKNQKLNKNHLPVGIYPPVLLEKEKKEHLPALPACGARGAGMWDPPRLRPKSPANALQVQDNIWKLDPGLSTLGGGGGGRCSPRSSPLPSFFLPVSRPRLLSLGLCKPPEAHPTATTTDPLRGRRLLARPPRLTSPRLPFRPHSPRTPVLFD